MARRTSFSSLTATTRVTAVSPAEPVRLTELRVLDGPNLYFTRPAVKLTLSVPGWLEASEDSLARVAARAGLAGAEPVRAPRVRPGLPGTENRRRFVARLGAHLARSLAH